MKKVMFFCLVLYGCASLAKEPLPPTGEEVFSILLNQGNSELTNEPLCNINSETPSFGPKTLNDHLSTMLSVSYGGNSKAAISADCNMSKNESNGKVMDIWDCNIQITETTNDGEFISSSMTSFGISLDKSSFIKGTLRCF